MSDMSTTEEFLRRAIAEHSFGYSDANFNDLSAMETQFLDTQIDRFRAEILLAAAGELSMSWGGPDHEEGLNEAKSQLLAMVMSVVSEPGLPEESAGSPTPVVGPKEPTLGDLEVENLTNRVTYLEWRLDALVDEVNRLEGN